MNKERFLQELFDFAQSLTDDDRDAAFCLRQGGYAVYLKAQELLDD